MTDTRTSHTPSDGGLWDDGGMPVRKEIEELSFTYEGPAVSDGSIDLADYGTALLGYSKMVKAAVSEIAPTVSVPDIRISKTEKGSFTTFVTLAVDVSVMDAVKSFLLSDNVLATASAVTVTGGIGQVVVSALNLAKQLRGRPFTTEPDPNQAGKVIIDPGDGTKITAHSAVTNVVINNYFRDGARDLLEPTVHEGVESVRVESAPTGNGDTVTLTSPDRHYLESTDSPGSEIREERAILSIERVAFDQAAWRFECDPGDGAVPFAFSAEIDDEDFLASVDASREQFKKGDKVDATFQVEIPPPTARRRRRYRVIKVHQVIRQDPLPGI